MRIRILAAGAFLCALVAAQPYRPFIVNGDSMTPTFAPQQILLGHLRPTQIARGDVVVFRHEGETMIKRVAYIPGDSIKAYRWKGSWILPCSEKTLAVLQRLRVPSQRQIVPPGGLYVLADNPNGTLDSRIFGAIRADDVLAVVPTDDQDSRRFLVGARMGRALLARL